MKTTFHDISTLQYVLKELEKVIKIFELSGNESAALELNSIMYKFQLEVDQIDAQIGALANLTTQGEH